MDVHQLHLALVRAQIFQPSPKARDKLRVRVKARAFISAIYVHWSSFRYFRPFWAQIDQSQTSAASCQHATKHSNMMVRVRVKARAKAARPSYGTSP